MNQPSQINLEDLEDILLSIEEKPPESGTVFMIDTSEKAAWAARKIINAKERIAQREAQRNQYKETIDRWYEKAIKEDADSTEFLMALLKPFVSKEVKALRKSKTLHLPGISLSLRKLPDKAIIRDEDVAISYCEAFLPGAVETKKTLSKTLVKEAINSGTIIPGAELENGGEELYIKGDSPQNKRKEEHHAA